MIACETAKVEEKIRLPSVAVPLSYRFSLSVKGFLSYRKLCVCQKVRQFVPLTLTLKLGHYFGRIAAFEGVAQSVEQRTFNP
jgi:hypothetical protein